MSNGEEPVAKRRRVSGTGHNGVRRRNPRQSRIFAPFRTVGLITPTPVPFTVVAQGKTTFQITTSAERCLQTFDLRRGMQLIFITRPQTPGPITAVASWNEQVIAGWATTGLENSRGIWIYKRGKKVGELEIPTNWDENIVQILVLGSWIIGCCETKILVWKTSTSELHTTIHAPFGNRDAGGLVLTGGICNIPTFMNKILAGREDGTVELWNVSTGRLIYTFQPPSADCGAVTALQPTPSLSLVAVAYMNGKVSIHDIRTDSQRLVLNAGTAESSPVVSISFRTDNMGAGADGRKAGVMATASLNSGDVVLWDLNRGGNKMGVLRGAHSLSSNSAEATYGGISKAEFLPNQGILITSGLDNSLKSWIFDEVPFSPVPRILHYRGGHSQTITTLNFLPTDGDGADTAGKWLLSSSQDRSLWGWSLRKDAQSTELSQGNIREKTKSLGAISGVNGTSVSQPVLMDLKAPPIICVACSLNRDGGMGTLPGTKTLWATAKQMKGKSTATEQSLTGWESIITGHQGEKFARTWFWGRKRAGRWVLETGDGSEITSVAISPCGTFALLGSASGGIDMYNLQSGQHRQRYPARLKVSELKRQENVESSSQNGHVAPKWAKGRGKHISPISGLDIDNLNRVIISCSIDGKIKFWNFSTGTLEHEIDWSHFTKLIGMKMHRSSDLVAFNCDDYSVRIIDIETKRLAREFRVGSSPILDFCFSNDGRWIITASDDSIIRVWDLPTSHLIDVIRLHSPCTALAYSPTGEYLATALKDSIGIDIWTNRTLFTHVPTRNLTESQPAEAQEPNASGEGGENVLAAAFAGDSASDDSVPDEVSNVADQLSSEVETLSLVPRSRWQTLVHLDLIRERNRPIQPPKPPEKLPFFLSSALQASQSENGLAIAQDPSTTDASERSRIAKLAAANRESSSKFTTLLHEGARNEDYVDFIAHLKTMPPGATDIEIRSLSVASQYAELRYFVHALTQRLLAKMDYELVQAWMAVFLRCHGEFLNTEEEHDDNITELDQLEGDSSIQGLIDAVAIWREVQRTEASRLALLMGYCRGVVGFLRGVT